MLVDIPEMREPRGVEEVDRQRAARLKKIVAARGWTVFRDQKRWAPALRRLRLDLKDRHDQIDAVLDWYDKTRPAKPAVHDGWELRKCFNWITGLMGKTPRRKAADVDVTPAAKKIARRVASLGWPKDAADQLPAAVQLSLENMKAFRAGLAKVGDPLKKLAVHFAKEIGVHGDTLCEEYFGRLHRRLKKWRDWSGDLLPFVWTPDRDDVADDYRSRTMERTGDRRKWDQLLREASHADV